MTLCLPKMQPHTKFIPASNNINEIYSKHDYSRNKVKARIKVTRKLVDDTPSSQDASTHKIWYS